MGEVVTLAVIVNDHLERKRDREAVLAEQLAKAQSDFAAVCNQFWEMTLINARLTDLNAALIAKILSYRMVIHA